ncbi:DNA cytosine methyltransferase [Candidatus Pacearchaeota archaeon]|nr:DNA cytosine methyltransferase [Candidatus Pacearchaeota archaeon]
MRALDLFCCAGGASRGLELAGFDDIVGVDIVDQPRYPYEFINCDVMKLEESFDEDFLWDFDYIWASPPCQAFTIATMQWKNKGRSYPDLIEYTRNMLKSTGKLYTIENVPQAPLINPVMLCGTMFGMRMYRHRIFESNFSVRQPDHGKHLTKNAKLGRPIDGDQFIQMVGHFSGVQRARDMTGCQWMNRYELAQCVPPAYSRYIATEMMRGKK